MKFYANPEKLLALIGATLIGLILLITLFLATCNYLIIIGIFLWLFVSFLIIRKNFVTIFLASDSFIFKYKGKIITILFKEVSFIKEISNYTNPLKCSEFYVIANNDIVSKIKIKNRKFSKWMKNNNERIKIVKSYNID